MTSIGPYTIEKTLGSGGFGTVYRCVHERLGWVRAIKVIHDPDLMDSIVEEARVVSELSHPNIVHLYDLDHRATPPYAVFEFVDGTDLAKLLRQGPLPWQEAVRIATEVLAALDCAHEQGVIHRDVKPSNILIARDGAVKLSDFGLGRIAELQTRLRVSRQSAPASPPSQMAQSRRTAQAPNHGQGAGTPFYMSPQQRRGEEPQVADDIYSLGVVLYEVLTGYLPEGAWPAPSEVAEAPKTLDAVVRRALALRREDRFASADEMRAALLTALAPSVTCPECGARRREDASDQFTCPACGREHLCTTHRDAATGLCSICVTARRAEQERAERERRAAEQLAQAERARQQAALPTPPRPQHASTPPWALPVALLAVLVMLGGVGTCMGVAYLNRQAQDQDTVPDSDVGDRATQETPPPPSGQDPARDGTLTGSVLRVASGGGGDFTDLADAIAAADNGDRLLVAPGTYSGSFVLEKRLQVVGDGRADAVIIKNTNEIAIAICVDGVEVRGLTVVGHGGQSGKLDYGLDVNAVSAVLTECNIKNCASAGILVRGGATPEVVSCEIINCDTGIGFIDRGAGIVRDCDIHDYGSHGIQIEGDANPSISACMIYNGNDEAIIITRNGLGMIQDCDISGTGLSGVQISDGGNPTIRDCRISNTTDGSGIIVLQQGRGNIADCNISSISGHGFEVRTGGSPQVSQCIVTDVAECGVLVSQEARGQFEGCRIDGSGYYAIEVRTGAMPTFRSCWAGNGKHTGVFVWDAGQARLEDCTVAGNAEHGVKIGRDGMPVVVQCEIRTNGGYGVVCADGSLGTVSDCDLGGNAQGAVRTEGVSQTVLNGNIQ